MPPVSNRHAALALVLITLIPWGSARVRTRTPVRRAITRKYTNAPADFHTKSRKQVKKREEKCLNTVNFKVLFWSQNAKEPHIFLRGYFRPRRADLNFEVGGEKSMEPIASGSASCSRFFFEQGVSKLALIPVVAELLLTRLNNCAQYFSSGNSAGEKTLRTKDNSDNSDNSEFCFRLQTQDEKLHNTKQS